MTDRPWIFGTWRSFPKITPSLVVKVHLDSYFYDKLLHSLDLSRLFPTICCYY